MKKINTSAFTFVELIVVLAILTILATIGITAYQSYLESGRDTNRILQLSDVHDGLELLSVKSKLPFPEDMIELTASGSIFAYQWYAGKSVIDAVGYDGGGKDPEFNTYMTYLLDTKGRDFQLLNFISDPELLWVNIPETYASGVDYQKLFPKFKGKPLGILLEKNTQIPLQESTGIVTDSKYDILSWTGKVLSYLWDSSFIDPEYEPLGIIIPNSSCRRIMELWKSQWDGFYNIQLAESWAKMRVYCNMNIAGGWWTLVARSEANSAITNFGWMMKTWHPSDDTDKYSFGPSVVELNFWEVMIATYLQAKNIEHAVKFEVNKKYIKDPANYDLPNKTAECEKVYSSTSSNWESGCELEDSTFQNWWFIDYRDGEAKTWNREEGYYFRYYATPTNSWSPDFLHGLKWDGFSAAGIGNVSLGNGGMIFVR